MFLSLYHFRFLMCALEVSHCLQKAIAIAVFSPFIEWFHRAVWTSFHLMKEGSVHQPFSQAQIWCTCLLISLFIIPPDQMQHGLFSLVLAVISSEFLEPGSFWLTQRKEKVLKHLCRHSYQDLKCINHLHEGVIRGRKITCNLCASKWMLNFVFITYANQYH